MRRLEPLQRTAILLAAASALAWVVVIMQMWVAEPLPVLRAVTPVAGTLSIVATILWIGGHNSRKSRDISEQLAENNRILAGTVERVTRPAVPRQTGPMRLHRVP